MEQQQENPDLLISLPHGLRLQNGLSFSVDDGPVQQFVFTTSDANGA
ncbi:hypothetical protein [uncultured Roseobacter sp.]|nr:hypothetical protein [uncultured Roseobacter sp.]